MDKYISINQELTSLSSFVKQLESSTTLIPTKYTIFRLDGHNFSKFTKSFNKPYDDDIISVMIDSAYDLLCYLNATVAFTCSDEIILLLLPTSQNNPLLFNGRVSKLESLSASYLSVRFNYHLSNIPLKTNMCEEIKWKKQLGIAHFDCRVFQCELDDIQSIFRWRQLDCFRNGVSLLARIFYSYTELQNKNFKKQILMLNNKNLNIYSPHILHGTWIKKTKITKKCIDYKTKEEVMCIRTDKKYISENTLNFKTTATPTIEFFISKYN
jgi:tRNA(His) guanylyltransferase